MIRRSVSSKPKSKLYPVTTVEDGVEKCSKGRQIKRGGRAFVPARLVRIGESDLMCASHSGTITDIHIDHNGQTIVTLIDTKGGQQRSTKPEFMRIQRVNAKPDPREGHINEDNMAKKNTNGKSKGKTTTTTKTKRTPRSRAASLSGVKPEDFFNMNARGKVSWKPGHDAKFASLCKRVIAGKGDADDKRLLKAKSLIGHDKITTSSHLSGLATAAASAL